MKSYENIQYRADIDGLRAFAVVSVLIFHAFPTVLTGGFAGVDIFFVISGFLISSIIFADLNNDCFSFSEFFCRRIRRIFPALLLMLFIILASGWFLLLPNEYKQLAKHIVGGIGFFVNFLLVEESNYFDNSSETKPMLHLWSLAVEEQFYIFWPLILFLAWRRSFNAAKIAITVAAISFSANLLFANSKPTETFFLPIGRLWELLAGGLLAWVYRFKAVQLSELKTKADLSVKVILNKNAPSASRAATDTCLAMLGLMILIFSVFFLNQNLSFPSYWALLPVMGTMAIIVAGPNNLLSRLFLMHPVVVWLGLISYPLYLWHWPLLSLLHIIEGGTPNKYATICALFFSILLAWLTYRFVETPIRRRDNLTATAVQLVALSLVVGTFALVVFLSNGLQNRASIVNYKSNLEELKRTTAKEEKCLSFLDLSDSSFDYCKIVRSDSNDVVVVSGDSHAHVAFPGISEELKKKGLTTVLMANSSCPPFIGAPWGRNATEKANCTLRINQILETLKTIDGLKTVIMFSRGPSYWTGSEPSRLNRENPTIEIDAYFEGLQKSLHYIRNLGVRVLYVTENPELKYQSRSCLPRPFSQKNSQKCEQSVADVRERQSEYLDRLSALDSIVVIDSTKAFCRETDQTCYAVNDQNDLLYADDNHLSIKGSFWQYNRVIRPFFE